MALEKTTTSVLNDNWAASFNAKCSCERGTTPLFYCNVEACPDFKQVYFCTDCVMLDEKHNHKKV
jgi:hypothetical protein